MDGRLTPLGGASTTERPQRRLPNPLTLPPLSSRTRTQPGIASGFRVENSEPLSLASSESCALLKRRLQFEYVLDAAADGADWREAVAVIFGIDPAAEPERARRVHDSHLARARWMTEHGYRQLLSEGRK